MSEYDSCNSNSFADMNECHRQEELQDKKDVLKTEQQQLKDKLSEEI